MSNMGKTIADVLREEGEKKGVKKGELRSLRRTFLRQYEARFGEVPSSTQVAVKAATEPRILDEWLVRLVKARSPKDIGIGTES